MEDKHNARELVASSSSARSFNSNLILFAISIAISILALFTLSPKVQAGTYPTMTEEQAQKIIDYWHYSGDNTYQSYTNVNVTDETVENIFNNISASTLSNLFNTAISEYNLNYNIDWNNIKSNFVRGVYGYSSPNDVTFNFLIYNNNSDINNYIDYMKLSFQQNFSELSSVNRGIQNLGNAKSYLISIYAGFKSNTGFRMGMTQNSSGDNLKLINNQNNVILVPRYYPDETQDIITLPFLINLGNESGYFYYQDKLYENNNNFSILKNDYITENSSGENSYYYWNTGVTTLDNNNYGQQIKNQFYIGNDLTYINNYYYYNESGERINANKLVNFNTLEWPQNDTTTGTLYLPKSSWIWYEDYYPNNIYQSLIVQYYSGDVLLEEKTVVDDILVINWSDSSISGDIIGTTTGTITNSSGEIIGNYSGEENMGNLGKQEESQLNNSLNIDIPIEDPTADFFTWLFTQIKECFTVDTTQYLRFTILDNEFVINSDNYILDIPVLNTILGTGSGIFILYGIFKDIRREIEKIKQGDFEQIGKEDISANML